MMYREKKIDAWCCVEMHDRRDSGRRHCLVNPIRSHLASSTVYYICDQFCRLQ